MISIKFSHLIYDSVIYLINEQGLSKKAKKTLQIIKVPFNKVLKASII